MFAWVVRPLVWLPVALLLCLVVLVFAAPTGAVEVWLAVASGELAPASFRSVAPVMAVSQWPEVALALPVVAVSPAQVVDISSLAPVQGWQVH